MKGYLLAIILSLLCVLTGFSFYQKRIQVKLYDENGHEVSAITGKDTEKEAMIEKIVDDIVQEDLSDQDLETEEEVYSIGIFSKD